MKFMKKKIKFNKFISQIKSEGLSMRRRFILYIISAIAMVISLILLLLNASGAMNHTNTKIMDVLDTQLTSYADSIEHDYDKTAAYAISFSKQLETGIQDFLTENNLSFDDLKDNTEALTDLQSLLYNIVYLNMQLAPSSGAFYILDTTVNTSSEEPLYNGIYLKYINLYSESTVNNALSLYRGTYQTGKDNGLVFHSGWQNEMATNFFENTTNEFSDDVHYILSPTVEVPDTWERARYVYVPIQHYDGKIIGICGFEVNDLYFQLTRTSNEETLNQPLIALFDEESGVCSGQFNSSRFNTADMCTAKITHTKKYTIFDFGTEKCIGKLTKIKLGNSTFSVAIMITEAQYNDIIKHGQMKTTGVFFIVAIFAFLCCLFMSNKYVAPILKKIEQIKTNENNNEQLKIREIDDLFAFLEEKDIAYEQQLNALKVAKQVAEEEAKSAKESYEKSLKKLELAQSEIEQLAETRKEEIDIEQYEYFINNLNTLTPTESKIYELYLNGKKAKEITSILSITENTLKYHNKNIYSKLGISSRKQLLRYATLKQHEDKSNP